MLRFAVPCARFLTESGWPRRAATPLLLLLGTLAAVSCSKQPAPEPLGPVPQPARLYYDNRGGITDSVRLVVRDMDTLREVWRQATASRVEPPPLPSVDMQEDMVLVVSAGRQTPEESIRVDSVGIRRERTADGDIRDALAVIVRTTYGCGRFTADAYPVEIVRVRRFEGPVTFIERRTDAECDGLRSGP